MSANSNVVTIRGAEYMGTQVAVAQRTDPHNDWVIHELERLLNAARNGDVAGIGIAVVYRDTKTETRWVSYDTAAWSLVSMMDKLKFDFIRAKSRE